MSRVHIYSINNCKRVSANKYVSTRFPVMVHIEPIYKQYQSSLFKDFGRKNNFYYYYSHYYSALNRYNLCLKRLHDKHTTRNIIQLRFIIDFFFQNSILGNV